jgi:membrane peptidoglycan carboxypeptidase
MRKPPNSSGNKPITTRSGKVIRVNRSLGERYGAMRQAKALRKVNRLRGLPKSRLKRLAWRLHPQRLANYWFSRDGGIMALKIVGIAILAMFILTLAVFAYYRKDLKEITDLSGSNLGGSISYYDSSGQNLLWQDYNTVKRVPVPSQNISNYVKQATVAVEDKDFYKHRGFDLRGIARASYVDVLHRGGTQGGSTITQQLVKLTQDFNQSRSVALKIKELILAVELERSYTKDQILTSYLDVAPYGSVDYGVQSASQDYFHVNAKDLTLAQAAFLAAIPKSPSYYSKYSPYFDEKLFSNRYNYVLDQMVSQKMITVAQAGEAKKTDILAQVQPQQNRYAGIQAPYFVLAAKDEVNNRFASQTAKVGGWKVITTLDMNLQQKAEQTVQNNVSNITRYGGDEEAMVVEDVKTGQMRALVGGTDFNNADHGQLNYAHDVNISPGSSFKPYDYVTLVDNNNNVGAGSVLYDSQGSIPGYPCTNKTLPPPRGQGNCLEDYDFKYPGPESLRYALGGSRNVPAVKAMLQAVPNDTSYLRSASVNKTIGTANALMASPDAYRCFKPGVDVSQAKKADETQCYGASAIGDGAYLHLDQHINGVASLARMGNAFPNTYIKSIANASGKTFYAFKQPKGTQVVRPEAAYVINNMASDPSASYLTGSYKWHRYKGWTTAVKTGTTNDSFDGLMMSWNSQYAVGSWVGYHTRNIALTTFMENLTIPLTRTMMEYAIDNSNAPPASWTEPSGIQHLPAYVVSHKISSNGEVVPSPATDIYPSWYKQRSQSSQNVTIDKVSGKVATNCTPDLAKQQLGGNAAPNAFTIDVFYPPGSGASASTNANTGATDDVHNCDDAKPSVASFFIDSQDASGGGTFTCSSSCSITATVTAGTHPFNDPQYAQFPGTVSLLANGQAVQSQQVSDSPSTVTFTYSGSGSVTLAVQVSDSVLYSDTTASATVNFPVAAVGPQNLTATNITNSSTQFTWTGSAGPYTVKRKSGGGTVCSSSAASTCTGTGNLHGVTVYVVDGNNNTSADYTVPS